MALELIRQRKLPAADARSKSWDEFAKPGAPRLDLIITVCDSAAGEACPVWPGRPATAHWSMPDPAAVEGSDEVRRRAFLAAPDTLLGRIRRLCDLPIAELDHESLKRSLNGIGSSG
jgi:arsenate reductase (thioredoxin)